MISPGQGELCVSCPEYTVSNADHTACIPADKIISKDGAKYSLYRLAPGSICHKDVFQERNQECVSEGIFGPISDLDQLMVNMLYNIVEDEYDYDSFPVDDVEMEDQFFFADYKNFKASRLNYIKP